MKIWIVIGMLLASSITTHAQQFENPFRVALPDSVETAELKWADLDNDGLRDVLVLAENSSNEQFLLTYKTDTVLGPQWQSVVPSDFTEASFFLADVDLDNSIDVILSGNRAGSPATDVWLNQGNFSFVSQNLVNSSGRSLKMADLDRDGYKEIILASPADHSINIYSGLTGNWTLIHDSIKVNATSLEVFDFDKDGDNDLFISGKRSDNSLTTALYDNRGDLYFTPSQIFPALAISTAIADLDHDGNFDVVMAGKNAADENISFAFLNRGNGFLVKDSLMALNDSKVFAADFNSNGRCDILYSGLNASGDTVNVIVRDDRTNLPMTKQDLHSQAFGDFDLDGDLDILQHLQTATGSELVILENTTAKNLPPAPPVNPIGVTLFNRLFLYWEEPLDDHTPSGSLTYDVGLQTSLEEWIEPEFDLISKKRLTVSHGNNGNTNYLLLPAPASVTNFFVQAIDNSLHAGSDCHGVFLSCASVQTETLEVCKNEEVSLHAPANALWFSFADGFLGESASWQYDPERSDTLFSVVPSLGTGCTAIRLYTIKISETLVKKTKDVMYVCEGAEVPFTVENGWASVEWSSLSRGFISNATAIVYAVLQNDSVKVKLSDNAGCSLQRSTALIISKPVVTLNGETFQILRGEQVQLAAAGGIAYHWAPSTGLSQDNVAEPVASPTQNTQYIVTVIDSLGCSAEASVLVLVEGTAFVPNLFTPNEDGKNDQLRIYGLSDVKNFSFAIHNREGSLVYETSDVTQATAVGWNGIVRGAKQPAGVYYWKVKGEQPSGRQLLLNGKRSGSIVLIR